MRIRQAAPLSSKVLPRPTTASLTLSPHLSDSDDSSTSNSITTPSVSTRLRSKDAGGNHPSNELAGFLCHSPLEKEKSEPDEATDTPNSLWDSDCDDPESSVDEYLTNLKSYVGTACTERFLGISKDDHNEVNGICAEDAPVSF